MEARVTTFMFLSGSGCALHSGARGLCCAEVGLGVRCACVGGTGSAACFIAWHSWLSDHLPTSG